MVEANQVISDRMIQVGQLADNLQYFYRLESETGIKILDLRQNAWNQPPKGAPKTFFTPVGFQVNVQGEYPKLLDLLRRLETGEHYCRIISSDFKPVNTDTPVSYTHLGKVRCVFILSGVHSVPRSSRRCV